MSVEFEERERFTFHRLSREGREEVVRKLAEVLSGRDEVLLAVVHGSFVEDIPFRDVDLAVYVRGCFDPLDYKFTLDEELERVIGYVVDTQVLNDAPYYFVINVLQRGRVVVEKICFLREALLLKAFDEEMLHTLFNR